MAEIPGLFANPRTNHWTPPGVSRKLPPGLEPGSLPTAHDIEGVGSASVPYCPYETVLTLGVAPNEMRFDGRVAVLCNAKDLDEPVLGLDVSQAFTLLLDVAGDRMVLTDRRVDVPS